jgi:hypothetical protein
MSNVQSAAASINRIKLLRLGLLIAFTACLTTAAFAHTAPCENGAQIVLSTVCPDGQPQQGLCVCTSWSESGGYSDCSIVVADCGTE